MKKLVLGFLLLALGTSFALQVDVFDAGDNVSINSRINNEKGNAIEDFEKEKSPQKRQLMKSASTLVVDGNPISIDGSLEYGVNNSDSNEPILLAQDQELSLNVYSAISPTDTYDATEWLECEDIIGSILKHIPAASRNLFSSSPYQPVSGSGSSGWPNRTASKNNGGQNEGANLPFGIPDESDILPASGLGENSPGDGNGRDGIFPVAPVFEPATISEDSSTTAPVPEPATVILFGAGLAGIAFTSRKRNS